MKGLSTQQDYQEVIAAVQDYFDAFYESDIEKMRRVFHPDCRLFSYQDDALQAEDLEPYLERVAARPSPASLGHLRYDKILMIDKVAPELALIKSQAARLPRLYTDYVTMLKIQDQWRVMSKTFSWVLIEGEPDSVVVHSDGNPG